MEGEVLPARRVTVVGRVREDVSSIPSGVSFGLKKVGESVHDTIILKSSSGKPFRVSQARPSSDKITVKPQQSEEPFLAERRYLVSAFVSMERDQQHSIQFQVVSNAGDKYHVDVPVQYFGVASSIRPVATNGDGP